MQWTASTWRSLSVTLSKRHDWYRFPLHSSGPCWHSKVQPPSDVGSYWNWHTLQGQYSYACLVTYWSVSKWVEVELQVVAKCLPCWVHLGSHPVDGVGTKGLIVHFHCYPSLLLISRKLLNHHAIKSEKFTLPRRQKRKCRKEWATSFSKLFLLVNLHIKTEGYQKEVTNLWKH